MMQGNPFHDDPKAEAPPRPAPSDHSHWQAANPAIRHLLETSLVVTVLLILAGGTTLAVAVVTRLATGADVA